MKISTNVKSTMVTEHVTHIFGTADSDLQLAGSRHITWTKPWPEPKAWAGLGFWRPEARAWISSSPAQAEPGRAEPAQHYFQSSDLFHILFFNFLQGKMGAP